MAYPSNTVDAILEALATYSEDNVKHLAEAVQSPSGFTADEVRLSELAAKTGKSAKDLAALLSVLEQLYTPMSEVGVPPDRKSNAIRSFLGQLPFMGADEGTIERVMPYLSSLLAGNTRVDAQIKLKRLAKGFVKNAVEFATFVDLRPNFSADGSSVVSVLPIVQLRISTDSEVALDRQFVCQMNADAIAELKMVIARAEIKLQTLMTHDRFAPLVVRADTNGEG